MKEPEPARLHRARVRMALRVAAAAAALLLLFTILPAGELWSAITSVPAAVWPLAVGAYLALHVIGVFKWRLLCNAAGAGLAARPAAKAYYWGLFGNLFLPSLVGGDLVRFGVAARYTRERSALVLGSLADRIQDVVGLALLAALGAMFSPLALDASSRRVFIALLLLAAGGVSAVAIAWRLIPVSRVPFRLRRRLVRLRQGIRATARQPGTLATALASGMLLQSLLVVLNWRLGLAIGLDAPLYVWFFVWPLAKISALVPVTQGGIGVREAAQAALFAPFGVPAVAAVATGLAFEVVIITGGLLSGAIALLAGEGPAPEDGAPRWRAAQAASPGEALGPANGPGAV